MFAARKVLGSSLACSTAPRSNAAGARRAARGFRDRRSVATPRKDGFELQDTFERGATGATDVRKRVLRVQPRHQVFPRCSGYVDEYVRRKVNFNRPLPCRVAPAVPMMKAAQVRTGNHRRVCQEPGFDWAAIRRVLFQGVVDASWW